ncbi:hypothetical protein D3C76_1091800 [compost metagenome]
MKTFKHSHANDCFSSSTRQHEQPAPSHALTTLKCVYSFFLIRTQFKGFLIHIGFMMYILIILPTKRKTCSGAISCIIKYRVAQTCQLLLEQAPLFSANDKLIPGNTLHPKGRNGFEPAQFIKQLFTVSNQTQVLVILFPMQLQFSVLFYDSPNILHKCCGYIPARNGLETANDLFRTPTECCSIPQG